MEPVDGDGGDDGGDEPADDGGDGSGVLQVDLTIQRYDYLPPPELREVLVANLISNAFRYTEQGEIRIERDGDELLVIDSGSGIDEELQPDVTKPAVKGHASPGLGLGLSIVERLCERCGWQFQIASSAEGTTARLVLG